MEQNTDLPLTEDDISSLLDGSANEALHQRLANDPNAQKQLEEARRFEGGIAQKLYRADCPSAHELGEYHLGLLNEMQAEHITQHLAICVRCQDELQQLEAFLALDADAPTPLRILPKPDEGQPSNIIHLQLQEAPPSRAVRGLGTGPMVAEGDDITLFLEVQQRHDEFFLMGQVVADDLDEWGGALLELRHEEGVYAAGRVDELGAVECKLPADARLVDLRLTSPKGQVILLEGIRLDE